MKRLNVADFASQNFHYFFPLSVVTLHRSNKQYYEVVSFQAHLNFDWF